jgi:hypothetical protein
MTQDCSLQAVDCTRQASAITGEFNRGELDTEGGTKVSF